MNNLEDEKKAQNTDCCSHEEGCDCGCCDDEPAVVELEDEKGNMVSCQVIDDFSFKDQDYVLVQNPDDKSVYLFRVEGEGEDGQLVVPEDDEFEEVSKYYESLLESEDK